MGSKVRVRTGGRRLGALSAVAAVAVAAVGALPGQSVGSTGSGSGPNAAWDLRTGGVFSMSNSLDGNRVVAFARAGGNLRRVGSFSTGGRGSGGFEDTANGLVLGTARGESAPNNLIEESRLLFATNAGSNSISVFRVWRHRLELVEVQHSRGEKPVSITVNLGIAYVLNSGSSRMVFRHHRTARLDGCPQCPASASASPDS